MKSLLIAGLVGMVFLSGGFWFGLRQARMPTLPKKPVADAPAVVAPTAVPDPITPESLQKASEGIIDLNKSLQTREHDLAAREQQVEKREDELDAERHALDRSHEKFNRLYTEFQQRLQLVGDSELDQLRHQAELYSTMDVGQSIDLIHAQDDPAVIRLFSVLDMKVLSKMITTWKMKYPNDVPRLLHILNGMGRVLPKDKMTIADASVSPDSTAVALTPDASVAPATNSVPMAPSDGNATNATPSMSDSTAAAPATNADAASTPPAITPDASTNSSASPSGN